MDFKFFIVGQNWFDLVFCLSFFRIIWHIFMIVTEMLPKQWELTSHQMVLFWRWIMYLALLHCQLSTQRYQRNSYSLSTQYIGIGGGAGAGGGGKRAVFPQTKIWGSAAPLDVLVPKIVNLRNRTGEERRWQTLCDDINFVWKNFTLKFYFPLNRCFCKDQKTLMLNEDHDITRK